MRSATQPRSRPSWSIRSRVRRRGRKSLALPGAVGRAPASRSLNATALPWPRSSTIRRFLSTTRAWWPRSPARSGWRDRERAASEEVEARLDEVRLARSAGRGQRDASGQRLERDLHDGAQRRLVALTLAPACTDPGGGDIDPELAGEPGRRLDRGSRGALGAARACPRHSSADPHRVRPRSGDRVVGGPRANRGQRRGGAGSVFFGDRGSRVLRGLGGARKRCQVRRGRACARPVGLVRRDLDRRD